MNKCSNVRWFVECKSKKFTKCIRSDLTVTPVCASFIPAILAVFTLPPTQECE